MTHSHALFLLVFLLAGGSQSAPSEKTPVFDARMYPVSEFHVSRRSYSHGEVTVQVIQAKAKEHIKEPRYCRAWFEIRKGPSLLKRLYYDDMEPVGFSYGIFVPREQPLSDYFVAVKEGDYDGRLLLVDKDGHVTNLPGGFYFLTADKRFLVGDYASDDEVMIVVDVAKREVVIDGREVRGIPEDLNWYRDSAGYFFTAPDESSKEWPPHEKKGYVYRLDPERRTVLGTPMNASQFARARKVAYDFDPRQKADCTSTPQ